jgi:hypothetical protein
VSKIPAQQQLPFFGQCLAIELIGADLVKPPTEGFVDLQLAVTEFGPNALPSSIRTPSQERMAHEMKRPVQHMRAVRGRRDGAASYVDLFHWVIGAARPVR